MSVELPDPVDDGHCVGCGPFSENGLRMRFETLADGSVESRVRVGAFFQGWRGVVHGGIVALLLDEAMAYAAAAKGVLGVTGELKMRFRKSVPVDGDLVVRANVLWQRRGVLALEASVTAGDGTPLASGQGSFVKRRDVAPGALGEGRFRAGT